MTSTSASFSCGTTTLTLLSIAEFQDSRSVLRAGDGTGLATAAIALYGCFAGAINNTWGRHLIPTFPEPGRRLAHLARRKKRPHSVTSSAGEREIARAES